LKSWGFNLICKQKKWKKSEAKKKDIKFGEEGMKKNLSAPILNAED